MENNLEKKNIPVKVIIQAWEESESGWGTKPDGFSLHLNETDKNTYCDEFMTSQRERLGERVPDIYERPIDHDLSTCYISLEKMEILKKSKNGIRTFDTNPDWISKTPLF